MKDLLIEWAPVWAPFVAVVVPLLLLRRQINKEAKDDAKWRGGIDQFRKSTTKALENITTRVDQIYSGLPPRTVRRASPMQLTEFGEEIAERLGATAWAEGQAPGLVRDLLGMQDFEVDMFCEDYVSDKLDDSMKERVAQTAYEFGIKRPDVESVLHVVLRGALLKSILSASLLVEIEKGGDDIESRVYDKGDEGFITSLLENMRKDGFVEGRIVHVPTGRWKRFDLLEPGRNLLAKMRAPD